MQSHTLLFATLLNSARSMRGDPTSVEQKMWSLLRGKNLGVRFRRQHPILNKYILDFYCHEARLAVEFDGYQHEEPEAIQYDAMRTTHVEQLGIRVLRVEDQDVTHNLEAVLEAVWSCLSNAPPPLTMSERLPQGGSFSEGEFSEKCILQETPPLGESPSVAQAVGVHACF